MLPYKFKIDVLGNIVESISHKVNEKVSPLSTSNFNEFSTRMLALVFNPGRIVFISDGTAVSLLTKYAYRSN